MSPRLADFSARKRWGSNYIIDSSSAADVTLPLYSYLGLELGQME
jgi:hypothetical protein